MRNALNDQWKALSINLKSQPAWILCVLYLFIIFPDLVLVLGMHMVTMSTLQMNAFAIIVPKVLLAKDTSGAFTMLSMVVPFKELMILNMRMGHLMVAILVLALTFTIMTLPLKSLFVEKLGTVMASKDAKTIRMHSGLILLVGFGFLMLFYFIYMMFRIWQLGYITN